MAQKMGAKVIKPDWSKLKPKEESVGHTHNHGGKPCNHDYSQDKKEYLMSDR